jgi:alanine-glyoxylate transaminase/serine-glyoxylate transaminase/serine-pyruvate transaminase
MDIDMNEFKDINPGERVLMGPGPSNVPPRVLQAMSAPCIGHLDPYFLSVMDETQRLLRFLFQTKNSLTIPVSGTGSAGMETCFVNLVERGEEVVVCVNGVFGTRMADIVSRVGGRLIRVEGEWGRAIDPETVRNAIRGRSPKLVAVVHAETSTGVCQPLEDIARIAREAGALFLVDMVTSLGGMEVSVDGLGIDAAYSGTQKCISCPPGLAPISFSDAAVKVLEERSTLVPSWYIGEEGLDARWARHRLNHRALVAGLEAMGLKMLVPESERLPMLNAVRIQEGASDTKVRKALLGEFGIEVGGGLGSLEGKVWRVGLMGHSSTKKNVSLFLSALETVLEAEGVKVHPGALEAASAVYGEA